VVLSVVALTALSQASGAGLVMSDTTAPSRDRSESAARAPPPARAPPSRPPQRAPPAAPNAQVTPVIASPPTSPAQANGHASPPTEPATTSPPTSVVSTAVSSPSVIQQQPTLSSAAAPAAASSSGAPAVSAAVSSATHPCHTCKQVLVDGEPCVGAAGKFFHGAALHVRSMRITAVSGTVSLCWRLDAVLIVRQQQVSSVFHVSHANELELRELTEELS
jgi:hypothetical protein